MSVDTPATIAIFGAGPIGLEAALYARFLGYKVELFDRGTVAQNVLDWGHVRLFSPFGMNRSTLGVAALAAQDTRWQSPDDSSLLTGREFADRYLLPLSKTDLLAGSIHEQTEVMAVGRDGQLKNENVGIADRSLAPFRVIVRDANGQERAVLADVVIDATGTYGNPCWMGQGGVPAPGERQAAGKIEYHVPDVLGDQRDLYAGRHTLLVGAGYSAATTALGLAELSREAVQTRVTWVTRQASRADGPIPVIKDDRLTERDRIGREANALAASTAETIRRIAGSNVVAIDPMESEGLAVQLAGECDERLLVDRIIANVGYRPATDLFADLQVHLCYASDGPMKLAASLSDNTSTDCLDQVGFGPDSLITTEPNFYILGSKSYGRSSQFLISIGLRQIRDLFSIIGDRTDLDLYEGIQKMNTDEGAVA
ncbi:MAG: FAD-dependent oxidoreductase [Pirellulales bacterium]|nr:FAD-dependent oxidoreductase [Pirellulales bacterium]